MRQRDVIRTIISRIWTFVPDDQRMCVRVDRDIFILNGDEDGEEFEPIFSQHGFRYVSAQLNSTFHVHVLVSN